MLVQTLSTPTELRQWSQQQIHANRRVALVPTMGYLHAGHASLIEVARQHGQSVVVSIFVNPTQFGPQEDFARYPRSLEKDIQLCKDHGAGAVFCPEATSLYPPGFDTYVVPEHMASTLCGASRPAHFRGVCTVVAMLLNISLCDVAVFGEKDYQQLQILRRMVADLWLGAEIIGAPIVRETDGLAMSSRNSYLSAAERQDARVLNQALTAVESAFASGERRPSELLGIARKRLEAVGSARIDYVSLVDASSLQPVTELQRPALFALAVFIGKTRLIDNRVLA